VTIDAAAVLAASGAGADDSSIADDVLAQATEYVTAYIATNIVDATVPVPDSINDAAVLACAVDLFAMRKAPFGQQVMPDANGTAVDTRIGSDPMVSARSKLEPWCVSIGFAYPEEDA
jgi:hypothetical protein